MFFLSQPGIDDYFKRDPADKKVKGTAYFFKVCYNDIGNLLLLCHACNIQKSDHDPLDWFKEQTLYFGEPFVKAVEQAGGLHEGVILARIYRPADSRITLTIEGQTLDLPLGE